jgi:hypothetical protein
MERKKRKPETARYVVKWISGNMLYFRYYKRDSAAVAFQLHLIESDGVRPEDIRIVMK